MGSHLKLGDHGDSTEPLAGCVLGFLIREDLAEQGVVRLLKQVGELWRYWILTHTHTHTTRWMSGWRRGELSERFLCGTHLVFLHHSLYLVVDFAGVMGHSEVWHLAELVPADVGINTELLLQTSHEGLCV